MKRGWVGAVCAAAAICAAAGPLRAQRWRVQYFYDEDKSTLVIGDIAFPSATRGLAVGAVVTNGHRKPVQLLTADGGRHWSQMDLAENPVSLFFLSDALGWLVTEKGLWVTTEMGHNWKRLAKPPADLLRVYFLDEKHGFGVGFKKKIIETKDAGEHWTPVAAADEPPGDANFSVYNWIVFPTARDGMISGVNLPPRRGEQDRPDWLDPEEAVSRRGTPHLSYSLSTHDGGATWKSGAASLFGDITRVRLMPDGSGLGLIEYSNSFAYPAEVKQINWHKGSSETVYRDKRFDVSDVWMGGDGVAYLAGIQVTGQLHDVVSGKVQVLRSKDMSIWEEMAVDYRAVATRVLLAGSGDAVWAATDAGMILKLEP